MGPVDATRHTYTSESKRWTQSAAKVDINWEPWQQGSVRQVYKLKNLTGNDEPNCVAKVSKMNGPPREYFEEAEMQALCKEFAQKYNAFPVPKKVDYLLPFVIEFRPNESPFLFACAETMLPGTWMKHNNNYGFVHVHDRNTPQTFSHFSWAWSKGKLLICDIQGVGDMYSDPQILSNSWGYGAHKYGKADLGLEGIYQFFNTHRCNAICHHIGLPPSFFCKDDVKKKREKQARKLAKRTMNNFKDGKTSELLQNGDHDSHLDTQHLLADDVQPVNTPPHSRSGSPIDDPPTAPNGALLNPSNANSKIPQIPPPNSTHPPQPPPPGFLPQPPWVTGEQNKQKAGQAGQAGQPGQGGAPGMPHQTHAQQIPMGLPNVGTTPYGSHFGQRAMSPNIGAMSPGRQRPYSTPYSNNNAGGGMYGNQQHTPHGGISPAAVDMARQQYSMSPNASRPYFSPSPADRNYHTQHHSTNAYGSTTNNPQQGGNRFTDRFGQTISSNIPPAPSAAPPGYPTMHPNNGQQSGGGPTGGGGSGGPPPYNFRSTTPTSAAHPDQSGRNSAFGQQPTSPNNQPVWNNYSGWGNYGHPYGPPHPQQSNPYDTQTSNTSNNRFGDRYDRERPYNTVGLGIGLTPHDRYSNLPTGQDTRLVSRTNTDRDAHSGYNDYRYSSSERYNNNLPQYGQQYNGQYSMSRGYDSMSPMRGTLTSPLRYPPGGNNKQPTQQQQQQQDPRAMAGFSPIGRQNFSPIPNRGMYGASMPGMSPNRNRMPSGPGPQAPSLHPKTPSPTHSPPAVPQPQAQASGGSVSNGGTAVKARSL